MSRSALSAKVFAVYLFAVGPLLVFAPNLLLSFFGFASATDVWVRALGVLAFNIGIYVWVSSDNTRFLRASVHTRALTFVAFTGFALLGLTSPMLILFGVIDLCGGLWTYLALKADARPAGAAARA